MHACENNIDSNNATSTEAWYAKSDSITSNVLGEEGNKGDDGDTGLGSYISGRGWAFVFW